MRTAAQTVLSVSELNRATRILLSEHFGSTWVEGEISNLAQPSSGHIYFSLRDADAQVRCAMFRNQNRTLTFQPGNGEQVLVRAQVSLYEPRGDYQLIVDYMEQAGDGALRRAFEVLKQRLATEGLFDPAHKKPIPRLPAGIGVITSPSGAAIHDILTVLKRRFPAVPVVLFPAKVQGSEARQELVTALRLADAWPGCELLILARGGGSLEDLWPFNEEIVARAIYRCRLPVVTGIGHEVDFTIADLVADLRAATPSAAAEAVVPDAREWAASFQSRGRQLHHRMREILRAQTDRLDFAQRRLNQAHPARRIETQRQRVDELELRLRRGVSTHLRDQNGRLAAPSHRLLRHQPDGLIRALEALRAGFARRLRVALSRSSDQRRNALELLEERLRGVSPVATLARGYAIVTRLGDGSLVKSVADVTTGDSTMTRLADGGLLSLITGTQSGRGTGA